LAELLVEQVVRLVDEADEDVSDHRRWARLDMGPIGLIGPILLSAQPPNESRFCKKRSQNFTVTSYTILAFWKESRSS
jgi:hypothetical protein